MKSWKEAKKYSAFVNINKRNFFYFDKSKILKKVSYF